MCAAYCSTAISSAFSPAGATVMVTGLFLIPLVRSSYHQWALAYQDARKYDRAAALTVVAGTPVLVVVGERDRMVPAAHARALAESVPGGTAVIR